MYGCWSYLSYPCGKFTHFDRVLDFFVGIACCVCQQPHPWYAMALDFLPTQCFLYDLKHNVSEVNRHFSSLSSKAIFDVTSWLVLVICSYMDRISKHKRS